MQNRIFSTDSAKAIKAQGFGYLNAIHYLAPSDLSGVNLLLTCFARMHRAMSRLDVRTSRNGV